MSPMKFDIYGKQVTICRENDAWKIELLSDDGKKRPAANIFIPRFITESEIEQYLEDLCHEWATEKYPIVRRID